MAQSKEFLVDMLGRVAGVNVIAIASLAANSPGTAERLGVLDVEGSELRRVTMKEFAQKH
jgi:hypothetical protein